MPKKSSLLHNVPAFVFNQRLDAKCEFEHIFWAFEIYLIKFSPFHFMEIKSFDFIVDQWEFETLKLN
jgi:hypothetical protein